MTVARPEHCLRPPLLQRGDTIGLVAPAGPIKEEVLRQGLQLLESFGLKIKHAPDICRQENPAMERAGPGRRVACFAAPKEDEA